MAILVIQLDSTALASAQWNDQTQTLDVTFRNGRTYTHEGVPQSVFEGLRDAPSPGNYYNTQIKGAY